MKQLFDNMNIYMTRFLCCLLLFGQASDAQTSPNNFFFEKNDSVNLYAFIGEKISIVEYNPNEEYKSDIKVEIDSTNGDTIILRKSYIMDNAFDAKYKVVQFVFNILKNDTIDFKVFDHYGRPTFENYPTVLLYVSRSEDGINFFHQKYQFDVLVKDKKGLWVGKNGESIKDLFNLKKKTVLKERGVFK